jgi:antitoxin component of MazEF toxin-antitoxin module
MADTDTDTIQVIELGADNTLTLPAEIAQALGPGSRVLVMKQGDTIILKRIHPPVNVLDRVAAMQDDEPPPTMEEMNEIVHEVRRMYREEPGNEDRR